MLTSRWVFSITLAASATLMLLALWVPAVMIWRRAASTSLGHLGRGAGGDLLDGGDAVFLVARVDALGAVAGRRSRRLNLRPENFSSTGTQSSSVAPG
jgi:hypothetical protein